MPRIKEVPLTIKALQRAGIPVTPGSEYIPRSWLPKRPISLQEVQRRLAKVKGNLADTVAELRETEG